MTAINLRLLTIKYRNQEVVLDSEKPITAEEPFEVGRKEIAEWLQYPHDAEIFAGVSRKHILIKFRESSGQHGGFHVCNIGGSKLLLDDKVVHAGPNDVGELLTGERTLSLYASKSDPERIYITVFCELLQATRETDVNWGRLVGRLKDEKRVLHIYGLPGVGKSHLINGLFNLNPPWPEKRSRAGFGDAWMLRIDGDYLLAGEYPLWKSMTYTILSSLRGKVSSSQMQFVNDAISQLQSAGNVMELDAEHILNRVFDVLRQDGNRLVLVLENFEDVYKQIGWRMIAWLRQVQENYANVRLVLVTRRALSALADFREDAPIARQITSAFHQLFHTDCILRMGCWPLDKFRWHFNEMAPGVSLPEEEQKRLWALTSGHPQLSQAACDHLRQNDLFLQPDKWLDALTTLAKEAAIYRCCQTIWRFLTPGERLAVKQCANGKELNGDDLLGLKQLGLLGRDNTLFSPLFAAYMASFETPRTGLKDENGWLLLDDQEISLGYQADPIIRYLLARSDRFCPIDDLVREFYSDEPYADPKDALRQFRTRNNKKLGGEFISYSRTSGYRLNPNPPRKDS